MTDCPLAQTRHVNAREVLNAELLAALQGALGGRGGYLWVPSAQVDTARERAARVAAMARPNNSRPSRSSRARDASVLARMAPAGLVVAVASTPASSRAGSIRSVRASTNAAWLQAGSVLWALVTIASAPHCRG